MKSSESAMKVTPTRRKRRVLFLCTENAARSQMAEAFLRKYAGDRFEVESAGLEPKEIHPLTIQVMSEAGLSLAGQRAKGVEECLRGEAFHYAIFVCNRAERACPVHWPSAVAKLFWPFDDPRTVEGTEEEKLAKFRHVRDQIERQIREWLSEHRNDE